MCYVCQNSGGVCSQSQRLRRRATMCCSGMDNNLFVPRGSSFKSTVVPGVRESNQYRLKGLHMQAIANISRLTKDREQITPQGMQIQRESDFKGSQWAQRKSQPSRGHLEGVYP
jgi:hypothetical protein